jgi:hypothetical protein
MIARPLALLVTLIQLSITSPARGDPADPAEQAEREREAPGREVAAAERLDLAESHATDRVSSPDADSLQGRSWVTLGGFASTLASGRQDVGALLVVGLALDRIHASLARPPEAGAGNTLGWAQEPALAPAAAAPAPSAPAQTPRSAAPRSPSDSATLADPFPVPASLARGCVAAAWRASGLGPDEEARVEAVLDRARESAWLPDLRIRAMRLLSDAAHATTLATTDGTTYYSAAGANLVLEARLTWRLDRLLYAGDEPAFERSRRERQDARARLAGRTLEALFAWQRAVLDVRESLSGSVEEEHARLRLSESAATLDVLTEGWFSRRDPGERRGQ